MKFNKNLDWLKESDEDDNLLADDELDMVEEEMNEGLYVDPSNYDKHNDLVDVVDKAGNPQKMTQSTYDKNKDSGEFEKKEPEEKEKTSQGIESLSNDIRDDIMSTVDDFERSGKKYSLKALIQKKLDSYADKITSEEDKKCINGAAKYLYRLMTNRQPNFDFNFKREEPKENKEQVVNSFEDIPDRNDVDWKNVSSNAKSDYERLTIQLFNKKKAHDSFAYSVVKSALDNNLDGAVISYIKEHMKETPEIAKALKEFDNALQEKDLDKSWKAYQNLWDAHRDATKRKRSK